MVNMDSALDETLTTPQLVVQSVIDDTAKLNYRYYYGTMVVTNGCALW
jgi:hypothetical protein